MLVTGSIIKPRILTSSSMVASRPGFSGDVLAGTNYSVPQRVILHLDILSQKILARRSKIYYSVACGVLPSPLACARDGSRPPALQRTGR